MKKIMIIGSPGSGKSTLSRELGEILGYPVLHLDYIFHIDNYNDIGREELRRMTEEFANKHDCFIIDGNYGGTMSFRMKLCDTVIFFDLPTDICIRNILKRQKLSKRPDMAPGFDTSIMDDDFIEYVKDFGKVKLPSIERRLIEFSNLNIIRINNYKEKKQFLASLR